MAFRWSKWSRSADKQLTQTKTETSTNTDSNDSGFSIGGNSLFGTSTTPPRIEHAIEMALDEKIISWWGADKVSVPLVVSDLEERRVNAGEGSIGDSVFNDLNANGVQDLGEPGIADVTLDLIEVVCGVPEVIATTITDSNGNYIFDALPAGDYEVAVTDTNDVLDGSMITTPPNPQPVELNVDEQNISVDFGYFWT